MRVLLHLYFLFTLYHTASLKIKKMPEAAIHLFKFVMQELRISLCKNKKSYPKILLGILSILCSVILIRLTSGYRGPQLFNIASGIWMFMIGALFLYEGVGKTLGKRFVLLTDEYLEIKEILFKPGRTFYLKEVRSINIGTVKIGIIDTNDKLHEFDLTNLDYSVVIEIKKRLAELSGRLKSVKRNKYLSTYENN